MRSQYDSYASPKAGGISSEKFDKMLAEVSKAVGQLNSTIRSIDQKVSLYGTSLDTRTSHAKINELVEKGNKLVGKIQKRLKLLKRDDAEQRGPRVTSVKKLAGDFKTQLALFHASCQSVAMHAESPVSSHHATMPMLSNYDEEQVCLAAQTTTYDEDDMIRREEDIIHINHQLREINAAFKEVDGLINDQHEVVVEIADNVGEAQDHVLLALEQVKRADAKSKYCNCSKRKMICYGVVIAFFLLLVLGVTMVFKPKSNSNQR